MFDNKDEQKSSVPVVPVNWDGSHFDEVIGDEDFDSEWKRTSAG